MKGFVAVVVAFASLIVAVPSGTLATSTIATCCAAAEETKANVPQYLYTGYFRTVEKYGEGIEWPSFSFTDYEEEREIVRKYFPEAIEHIESGKAGLPNYVKIAIAKADLNGDSRPEIIWILFHRYFRGAQTTGHLGIFAFDGDEMKFIRMPQIWMPEPVVANQGEVGIRTSPRSNWKDFFVNGQLWRWDGEGYSIVKD